MQNSEWKYIRYYKNNTFPAVKIVESAKLLGMQSNKMLYGVHDSDIAVYRDYIESPLQGEQPVYEELFYLKNDKEEAVNLAKDNNYKTQLETMRKAWQKEIIAARGEGKP